MKFLLNIRWNVADIFFLIAAMRFLEKGNWLAAIMMLVAWFPLTVSLEVYGKKHWGWK